MTGNRAAAARGVEVSSRPCFLGAHQRLWRNRRRSRNRLQQDTTTVVEPIPQPEARPPPKEDVKPQGPAHVPPDASGIDLTTLETKDLDLLYFDPLQTYLTPYIARAFENALQFHKRKFQWTPWEPTTMLLKDFSDYATPAPAPRRTTRC